MIVSYNDPQLTDQNLITSPFVIALQNIIPQSSSSSSLIIPIFNLIIIVSLISAANSNIYFGSRTLLAIGETKSIFLLLKTNNSGIPYISIIITSLISLISLILNNFSQSFKGIFINLLNCVASAGLLMWCLLGFSFIRYYQCIIKYHTILTNPQDQLVHPSTSLTSFNKNLTLPKPSSLLYFGCWFATINILIILITNGLTYYSNLNQLVISYLTPILFIVIWIVLHYFSNETSWLIPLNELNLFNDRLD